MRFAPLARLVLAAALTIPAAACSSTPAAPSPPRSYTAWMSSPGGAVNYRIQVDGAFVDQGTRQPMSTAEAYVTFSAQAGQRVTFTAAIARSGFAGCRIVRDDGVEVVPLQQQHVTLSASAPPAECAFVGS